MRPIPLPDGRRLACDDLGDESSPVVLHLHGTPDSRLARHPDDSLPAALGLRLLCPDRPGIGDSDPDPAATPASVADDLVAALDHLGIEEVRVLAWSAGAIFALALAGAHPGRVGRVVLAAPLVPADAYADRSVLEGADASRRLFAELVAEGLAPDTLAAEVAPFLVPVPCAPGDADEALATTMAAVAHIPGAGRRLREAYCASVAAGPVGVARDVAAQATPLGPLLDRVRAEVLVHVGAHDVTAPPAMARWVAERLGAAAPQVHPGQGHALAITAWRELLEAAGR